MALLLEAAVSCSCQLWGRQKVYQQPAEGRWTSAVPQSRPPAGLEDTSGNEAGTYYTLRKKQRSSNSQAGSYPWDKHNEQYADCTNINKKKRDSSPYKLLLH